MSDESIGREIRQLRDDVRDDFGHLREVFGLRLDNLAERVKKLEDSAAAEVAERRATRKWLIGAVVVPSVMMLLTLVLTVWGPR